MIRDGEIKRRYALIDRFETPFIVSYLMTFFLIVMAVYALIGD